MRLHLAAPLLLLSSLCLPGAARAAEAPAVAVTIQPVHALVAAVMEGVGEPRLLLPAGASPHHYSLKPSDAAALDAARMVVWVGPALELFMQRPLASLAAGAEVLTLAEIPGIELLALREGGPWAAHDHGEEKHEDGHGHKKDSHGHSHKKDDHGHKKDGHGHSHGKEDGHDHKKDEHAEEEHGHGAHATYDGHLWLSPANARAIVAEAAGALSRLDPANAARYAANAEAAKAGIDALDAELKARLAPVRAAPYVVFHDAYQYFEQTYGLSPVGSIALGDGRAPGARRVTEIRERIVESGARCVFREPQSEPALVATVTEGTGARTGVLDPLGAGHAPGPEAWAATMRGLADSLTGCLAGG